MLNMFTVTAITIIIIIILTNCDHFWLLSEQPYKRHASGIWAHFGGILGGHLE